jgi:hypothetical protein
MGIDISPMPERHGQTPARRLRVAGKRMPWRAGRGFIVRHLPECARPRAQQRDRARRHRIDRSVQQSGHCSGRGRPHSAVNFAGDEVTRLIILIPHSKFLILHLK